MNKARVRHSPDRALGLRGFAHMLLQDADWRKPAPKLARGTSKRLSDYLKANRIVPEAFMAVYPVQKKPIKTLRILKFRPHFKKEGSYVKKGRQSKLTEDQARAILVLKPTESNWNEKAIALGHLLNVSPTTICGIWSRKRWKHLG